MSREYGTAEIAPAVHDYLLIMHSRCFHLGPCRCGGHPGTSAPAHRNPPFIHNNVAKGRINAIWFTVYAIIYNLSIVESWVQLVTTASYHSFCPGLSDSIVAFRWPCVRWRMAHTAHEHIFYSPDHFDRDSNINCVHLVCLLILDSNIRMLWIAPWSRFYLISPVVSFFSVRNEHHEWKTGFEPIICEFRHQAILPMNCTYLISPLIVNK